MKTRPLGRTGLEVSEVGFGAWGIGGGMWRGVGDAEARKCVHEALDLGVSLIDTALAYGDGYSERLLGEILRERGRPDGVVVATKIPPKDDVWPGLATTSLRDVFPADWVVKCVERSLRSLGVDALDLEQLHVWNDAWLAHPEWHATRAAMVYLKEQGKVRHWGISINDHAPETALGLLEDPLIETAQVIYNVFDRSPERELFDLARRRGIGILVRVPFDEGALTGSVRPDTVFEPGDWRGEYFRAGRKAELEGRLRALEALLGEEARTLPELALRFCLSRPEVSTVIPGMRRPAHARANVAVADGRALSAEMLERLRLHAWDKNWYD